MENQTILIVDDEQNVLSALQRKLYKKFNIMLASSGEKALSIIKENTISVMIVDMRMPNMNGVQLLEKASQISPLTIKIMLTGNVDQNTAIDAINKGKIFRFLNKPCDDEILILAIEDAIKQYNLLTIEKNLIETTLAGSVKVLIDILSQLNPTAFKQCTRVKEWSAKLSKTLNYPTPWELGLAALLCPIGMVSLPADTLARFKEDKELQPLEKDLVKRAPEVAAQLISNIPRLENIAKIVSMQYKNYDGSGFPVNDISGKEIPLGSRILRILNDLAEFAKNEIPSQKHFNEMIRYKHRYDMELFHKIKDELAMVDDSEETGNPDDGKDMSVLIKQLKYNDYLMTDIETIDNHIILSHGNFITEQNLERLNLFKRNYKFREPIKIRRGLKINHKE